MLTPLGLDLLHLEVGGSLHRGDAGELSNFKIKSFDCVEYIALVNNLVVNNPYIADLTRHLGRDVRNLHTYGAVPRPGSGDILLPCKSGDQERNECDGERGKVLAKLDEKIPGSTPRPQTGWSRRGQRQIELGVRLGAHQWRWCRRPVCAIAPTIPRFRELCIMRRCCVL